MTVNHEIAWSILAAVAVLGLVTGIAVYLMIGMAWREFQSKSLGRNPDRSAVKGSTLMRYALSRKCPNCGRGNISRSFLWMNESCSVCGVSFWTNEGEWIGPVVINYAVAFGAALGVWAMLVMFDCSATLQVLLPSLAAIIAVLALTPWTNSLWTLFLYLNGELGGERQT